jgi:hypothetical protein
MTLGRRIARIEDLAGLTIDDERRIAAGHCKDATPGAGTGAVVAIARSGRGGRRQQCANRAGKDGTVEA